MKKIATKILAGALLALCVTQAAASDLNAAQVAAFKPGIATYRDVIGTLGQPMSTTTSSDGTSTIVYGANHSHPKLATFIPYVGLFAGGAISATSSTVFIFDANGMLLNSTTTNTHVDCSINILSVGCNSGQRLPSPVPNGPHTDRSASPVR